VFLNTASSVPLGHRALRWAQCGLAALLLAAALVPWMSPRPELLWITATVLLTAATHFVALGAAVAAWRNGEPQARFFVAAFGLLVLGGIPTLIAWLTDDNLPGMERGFLAGSTLEMVLLSFAVADRFAQAQRQLIEETKQRRMIESTYLDELEVEVRERTRELRLANADKDRMLAVIGHDLRGPLAGLMQAADRTTGPFALETARTGRALLLMIEDLVLWARLRAGTRVLGTHPASGVLLPAVALHRSLAEYGGIELVVQVTDELRVRTDLVLVQTLVRNLLANALKFARRTVILRAEADAEHNVRFSVGNDGAPLSPDVAARFASGTDEAMTATGGLGLRLCREICLALGMRLEARTPAEGGTEFSFTVKSAAAATVASSS
jgi:signal transduction histidine kinase